MKIAIYHNLPSGGQRALYEMTRRLARQHEVGSDMLTQSRHRFFDLPPLVRLYVANLRFLTLDAMWGF